MSIGAVLQCERSSIEKGGDELFGWEGPVPRYRCSNDCNGVANAGCCGAQPESGCDQCRAMRSLTIDGLSGGIYQGARETVRCDPSSGRDGTSAHRYAVPFAVMGEMTLQGEAVSIGMWPDERRCRRDAAHSMNGSEVPGPAGTSTSTRRIM